MPCRCPMCAPWCPCQRHREDMIDRWNRDWDRAARNVDPDYERRRKNRVAEYQRRMTETLRKLTEQAERERREIDPNLN